MAFFVLGPRRRRESSPRDGEVGVSRRMPTPCIVRADERSDFACYNACTSTAPRSTEFLDGAHACKFSPQTVSAGRCISDLTNKMQQDCDKKCKGTTSAPTVRAIEVPVVHAPGAITTMPPCGTKTVNNTPIATMGCRD